MLAVPRKRETPQSRILASRKTIFREGGGECGICGVSSGERGYVINPMELPAETSLPV
jgi:hypothetical protein